MNAELGTDDAVANDRYCLVGIGVMFVGVGYWAGWRILLPKVFGYELVPRKETLEDGTVVTLVRALRPHREAKLNRLNLVFAQENSVNSSNDRCSSSFNDRLSLPCFLNAWVVYKYIMASNAMPTTMHGYIAAGFLVFALLQI